MTNLPSGTSYSSFEVMIEKIAEQKANKYGSISYLDKEDIKQEVRLKCYQTLGRYNPQRTDSNIKALLSIAADNRLRDIKRKLVYNPSNQQEYSETKYSSCIVINQDENSLKLSTCPKIDSIDFEDYAQNKLGSGVYSLYCELRDFNFSVKFMSRDRREDLFVGVSGCYMG